MSEKDRRSIARDWLSTLSDKEFAEFFYDAVRGRRTSDIDAQRGHFVLADASRDPDSPSWDVDFISLPSANAPWDKDAPICQWGTCSACQRPTRSWAKHHKCPICGTDGYGS